MVEFAWLLADLLNFVYNLGWLVFLTHKHYGQVTTTAGHIFELNVQLNNTISVFIWIVLVDLDALNTWCIVSDILDTILLYSQLVAIAGSQIETAIFLKKMNVNTMMTNTAGKIILAMTMAMAMIGVIVTFVLPSRTLCLSKTTFCEFLKPTDFYRVTIPATLVLLIILSVLVFTVFRSHQITRKRDAVRPENDAEGETHQIEVKRGNVLNDKPPTQEGRLLTITMQTVNSEQNRETEENQETLSRIVENDIVVDDIEFVDEGSPPSSDQVSIGCMVHEISQVDEDETNGKTEIQQNKINCLPGIGMMQLIQTLNKYFKNTLMSLLILTSQLPWYSTAMYGFITNSGCENPTFRLMSEISEYSIIMFNIILPVLIKLKLDRLSK